MEGRSFATGWHLGLGLVRPKWLPSRVTALPLRQKVNNLTPI